MTARCYSGSQAWAKAWAQKLVPRVGTRTLDGRYIVEVRAQGYGETHQRKRPRQWCVVEVWTYPGQASLGTFGKDTALLLERKMPT